MYAYFWIAIIPVVEYLLCFTVPELLDRHDKKYHVGDYGDQSPAKSLEELLDHDS